MRKCENKPTKRNKIKDFTRRKLVTNPSEPFIDGQMKLLKTDLKISSSAESEDEAANRIEKHLESDETKPHNPMFGWLLIGAIPVE